MTPQAFRALALRPVRRSERRLARTCAVAGAVLALAAALRAGPVLADPCAAIPDKGPLPAYLSRGASFSGPVTYVGDGDSLCVALGPHPDRWVEVRLADFYAPELRAPGGAAAKAALDRLTAGQQVRCTADHRSYDRIVAICRINARSLGDLLRAQGVVEGGRGRK
nr:nuclease [Caulobacter soli]